MKTMTTFMYEHPVSMDYEWMLVEFMKHMTLLRTPLELGQFIPCKDGKPLEKPERELEGGEEDSMSATQWKEYQQAEDRVLFKNITWEKGVGEAISIFHKGYFLITYANNKFYWGKKTIEDLCGTGIELKT